MVRKIKRKPAVEKQEGQTGSEEEQKTEDGEKASQEDLESGDHEIEGESGEEEEFEIIEGTIQICFTFTGSLQKYGAGLNRCHISRKTPYILSWLRIILKVVYQMVMNFNKKIFQKFLVY